MHSPTASVVLGRGKSLIERQFAQISKLSSLKVVQTIILMVTPDDREAAEQESAQAENP